MARVADLSITKTVDLATALPGDSLTYTIVVSNAGPSDITGAAVSDVVPADLAGASWTCTPLVGGACGAAGPVSGDISTTVDLAVGGSVSFTLTGTVAPTATGTIVNTADVTAPAGASDPNPANNSASAATAINPKADLSITKTDGNTTDIAGTSIQYSIVVTNNGPSTIQDAPVNDTMPAELSAVTWTCTPSAFSACAAATGTGDIATTVDLRSGATATFVVDAIIAPGFSRRAVEHRHGDHARCRRRPDPGQQLGHRYHHDRRRGRPGRHQDRRHPRRHAGRLDGLHRDGHQRRTVVGHRRRGVRRTARWSDRDQLDVHGDGRLVVHGFGRRLDRRLDLAAARWQATYQVTVDISSAATGTLVNTASVAPPAVSPTPHRATTRPPTSTRCTRVADLSITKTDGAVSAVPGTPVTYTVVVSNAGPSDAVGATVTDVLPASLVAPTWTCTGTGGGICTAAGAGNIADIVTLPGGRRRSPTP